MEEKLIESLTFLKQILQLAQIWKRRRQLFLSSLLIYLNVHLWVEFGYFTLYEKLICFVLPVSVYLIHVNLIDLRKVYANRVNSLMNAIYFMVFIYPSSLNSMHALIWRIGTFVLANLCNLKLNIVPYILVELLYYFRYICSRIISGDSPLGATFLSISFNIMILVMNLYQQSKKRKLKNESAEHIQMLKERTEILSVKNKFIATVTHEIRNFVSNIVTNSSLLKESEIWNEEIVNELVQASSFLSEILNNTLDISKLEEGKIEFNKSFEPIKSVVDIVLSISKGNADKKEIKLKAEYCEILPDLLEIDKSRLTQIVMNLVGNAIKFTPNKGQITVKVTWKFKDEDSREAPIKPSKLFTVIPTDQQEQNTVEELKDGTDSNIVKETKREDQNSVEEIKEDNNELNIIKNMVKVKMTKELSEDSINEEKEEIVKKIRSFTVDFTYNKRTCDSPEGREKVPDENSPIGGNAQELEGDNTSARKIAKKIKAHLFMPKMHERSLTGFGKLETRSLGGSTPFLANTPECGSDSIRIKDGIEKKMSSFGMFPIQYQSANLSGEMQLKRRKSLLGDETGFRLLKIKGLSKEFGMSTKLIPICEQKSLAIQNSAEKKEKVTLKKRAKLFHITPSSDKNLRMNKRSREGTISIEVIDTGCGMTEAEKEKLFKPFSQANKSVQSKFGGTGLGLWLSYKLVTAMGGAISCDSKPQQGTTFKVTLNVKSRSEQSELHVFSSPSANTFKDYRILCRLKSTEGIQDALTKMGCILIDCKTTEELIEKLRDHKKTGFKRQVVVAGKKAIQEINKQRKIEALGITPSNIVVITNSLIPEDDESFRFVLTKPINPYYLLRILGHIVKGQILCSETTTPLESPIKKPNSSYSGSSSKGELRILIVDDSPFCNNATMRLIQKHTSNYTQCCDGIEAISAIKASAVTYDLAVIDYQMPNMDGLALIKAIREHEGENKTLTPMSILFLSGDTDQAVEEEAIKLGANFTAKKPISSCKLDETINQISSDSSSRETKRGKTVSQFAIYKNNI